MAFYRPPEYDVLFLITVCFACIFLIDNPNFVYFVSYSKVQRSSYSITLGPSYNWNTSKVGVLGEQTNILSQVENNYNYKNTLITQLF